MPDTTLIGLPLTDPVLDILTGWPRRIGRAIPGARYAEQDTGSEHGPQTYLAAVASEAHRREQDWRTAGEGRRESIDMAFTTVPPPVHLRARFWSGDEIAYVRAVLQAGDHAADAAALRCAR